MIFWRGLRATVRMKDDFGRYLALGVTVVVVVQGFINMSVVLGMMPTKGIPLPMISYGGSSLLSTLALLGILMNVASMRDSGLVERGKRAVKLPAPGDRSRSPVLTFLMAGGGTGGHVIPALAVAGSCAAGAMKSFL